MYRLFRWLVAGLWIFFRAALVLWAVLAIYYSNLPWPAARLVLATVFAAFAVWAIWIAPGRRPSLALFVLYYADVPGINHMFFDRLSEINQPGTSGYARYVAPMGMVQINLDSGGSAMWLAATRNLHQSIYGWAMPRTRWQPCTMGGIS